MTKSLEECNQKALKTGFVEHKRHSGPLSVVSKTLGKCQLSIKILGDFSVVNYNFGQCQLSVNIIHTLIISFEFTINRQYAQLILNLIMSLVTVYPSFRNVGLNNLLIRTTLA